MLISVLRSLAVMLAVLGLRSGINGTANAQGDGFDLRYVADEGGMVIAVRPERIFSSPQMKPLVKLLDETGNLRSRLTFSVSDIDQFVLVMSPSEKMSVPRFMLKAKEKIDLQKFIDLNVSLQSGQEATQVEHRGKTYTTATFGVEQTVAFWRPQEGIVVGGTVEHIERCIEGWEPKRTLLDLDQWKKVEKSPLAIALDKTLIVAIAKDINRSGDEPTAKLLAPLAEHVEYAVASVNIGKRMEILVLLECATVDGAKDAEQTIEAILAIANSFAKQAKESQKDAGPLGQALVNTLDLATQLIEAAEINRHGRELQIVSSVEFKAFQIGVVEAAVSSAQISAQRAQSANNLKQMGLAFHREPIRLLLLIGLVQRETQGLLLMRWLCCVWQSGFC